MSWRCFAGLCQKGLLANASTASLTGSRRFLAKPANFPRPEAEQRWPVMPVIHSIVTAEIYRVLPKRSWAGKRRGLLSQYLVNERDGDRPFAYSRGDAFDVAATNIPGSENSGHTAFQQVWPTGERPVRAGQIFRRKIGTCLNKAFVIERDATIEPAGVGVRSGHYEHVSDVLLLGFAGFAIPPRDPFEMVDAFEADNFRACQQADVRRLFNATNEIFRHCVSEARTSDEHVHVLCALRQKNSGLARGISTANHDDFLAAAQLRLNKSCPVINAGSFKAGQIFNRQLAVFGSGSDDDRARWDPGAIFHLDLTRLAVTG